MRSTVVYKLYNGCSSCVLIMECGVGSRAGVDTEYTSCELLQCCRASPQWYTTPSVEVVNVCLVLHVG